MGALLASKPQTYKQLLKRSLILYRVGFLRVIPFALILSFFVFTPRLLFYFTGESFLVLLNDPMSPYQLILVGINILVFTVFIAILWHLYCEIKKMHESLTEDIILGIRKIISVFLAVLIVGITIRAVMWITYWLLGSFFQSHLFTANIRFFLALFALIGQFFLLWYIYILFIFFLPLIVIENKDILHALGKSASLTWNHWWRVFSLQITPWICYFLFLTLLKDVFRLNIRIYFFMGPDAPSLLITFLHLLIFALFIPWIAALLLIQLKDLELRKSYQQNAHDLK